MTQLAGIVVAILRARHLQKRRRPPRQRSFPDLSAPRYNRRHAGKVPQAVTSSRPHRISAKPITSRMVISSPNKTAPNSGVTAKARAANGYARDSGVKVRIQAQNTAYAAYRTAAARK